MTLTVILHISDQAPIMGEIEELPDPMHQIVTVNNPRTKDGKDLHYLSEGVVTVIWPLSQVNFIEVMASREEEEIFGFVRE